MAVVTFDTLECVDTLAKAGFSESQARALSAAVRNAHNAAELLTKQDVVLLEARVDHQFEGLRKDMQSDLASVRKDMQAEFASVRKDMQADFAGVRKDMQLMQYRIIGMQSSVILVAFGILETVKRFL
jgi:hypothetical protein